MNQQEINQKREKLNQALRLLNYLEFSISLDKAIETPRQAAKQQRRPSLLNSELHNKLVSKFNQIIKEL